MREVIIKTGLVPIVVDITILIPLILFWALGYPMLYLIALFFSLLHELAHLAAAKILGYTPERITINMFGEVLHLAEDRIFPEHQVLIHLAGPVFNLLAAFVSFFFAIRDPYSFYFAFEGALSPLEATMVINLFLALFNLMPCFPLDGGKVVMVYLSYYFGEEIGRRAMLIFSSLLSALIFFLGLYLMKYNPLNGLISMLAFNLFLGCRRESSNIFQKAVWKEFLQMR